MSRESIHSYFLKIAEVVATRSTCERKSVGCVIVKNKNILSTGFNGSPSGLRHCLDIGCEIVNGSCERTTHSEQNAICQAAKNGIEISESTLYTTLFPCYNCAKIIINSGISRIYYKEDYHSQDRSKKIFKEAHIFTKKI